MIASNTMSFSTLGSLPSGRPVQTAGFDTRDGIDQKGARSRCAVGDSAARARVRVITKEAGGISAVYRSRALRFSRRRHNARSRESRMEDDEVVAVDDLPGEGRAVFVS